MILKQKQPPNLLLPLMKISLLNRDLNKLNKISKINKVIKKKGASRR